MRTMWLALFALMLSQGIATAQDDGAIAIVKKAIEAHGGADALNKTKTARSAAKGNMTVSGQELTFSAIAVYSVPDKYKLEIQAEISGLKLTTLQVLNGKKTKIKTMLAGTEQPSSDKMKEETIQAGLLQEVTTLTPLLDVKKYTIKMEKDADVKGTSANVVLVTGNGVVDVRLFFDAKAGNLIKTQRKGIAPGPSGVIDVVEETFLSEFKKTDGALLPTKVVVEHDKKKFMTMTVTEMKLLDKVDANDFKTDD